MVEPAPTPPAGLAPESQPGELTEFFCYDCDSSASLPVEVAQPMALRPPCPRCGGNFLEPGPSPFPGEPPSPPPFPLPGFVPGEEESELPLDSEEQELDELEDIDGMDYAEARLYIAHFIRDPALHRRHARLYTVATREDIEAATNAALSLLEDNLPRPVLPAPASSIDALPIVEVSNPGVNCAICLEDLPLASPALELPCSHFYHSHCVVAWLRRNNSCPMCRLGLPVDVSVEATPSDLYTTITIRLTARRRAPVNDGATVAEGAVSSSPTQLAQAGTGEGGSGPANSADTVSSEFPPQPDSDTVMSEARDVDGDGDGDGFLD